MSTPFTISYPPELPVSQVRDELARVIAENQVVIVAGETGSGKTTQLPKICLDLGRTAIGHTQPRRIAARSVAERIAHELGVDLGGIVGYQVRFDDRSARDTAIKLMTDGVLLAELQRDPDLRRYDTIIIDEAHERSLTIDFLLGYLRRLLPRRPDLKVIVTSATIDPQSFARHFADAQGTPAPIVEVSGRTYPVEIRYRPLVSERMADDDDETVEDLDYLGGIRAALDELAREPDGDVLVFLSGETEIRDAQDALSALPATEVLPLYGRLSAADQHRVFDTRRAVGIRRRVVLATNVAETSLTVPGIKYVVDAGQARISRYSPRAKVQRLPIEAISQASANQRSGRAGRTSDGIAIRLYAEEDFERRPAFTDPEILRTDLAAVILQMAALRLGDIQDFPFLQPPDKRGVRDGVDLLTELGALDGGRLTETGRILARLPVDVRFGRMLVEAKRHGVVREVAAIVAGLSIQDPRERPLEKRAQADQAHARFADPSSDFVTLLNLWNHLEREQQARSGSAFRRMCKTEYLNYLRIREWQDLNRQLLRAAKPLGLVPAAHPSTDADAIHRSLLAGLLSRIGMRDRRTEGRPAAAGSKREQPSREYQGARGQRFVLFPGSALAKKTPEFVMAAELVDTSRLFARTAAAIDPAWAEKLAGDLAKRSWSEPHWEKKQGSAVAVERVTLFGLPIVARRRVQLARYDVDEARELFLRHALVEGDWPAGTTGTGIRGNPLYDFDRANRALRRELEEVEERSRRRDILSGDEAVVAFYDARIPRAITDVRAFERWWKDARTATPDLLTMTRADLLDETEEEPLDPSAFPDRLHGYALRYRFEPGAADDGVTVELPVERLPSVDAAPFAWLVPGLREELVTALLRALPKSIRKNVVPAGDWARRLLPALDDTQPLLAELGRAIRAATHTPVDPGDFELDRVPANLRMTFAAVDGRGARLGTSKDLGELTARFAARTRETVAKVTAVAAPGRELERTGLTTWDVGALPEVVEAGGVRGYPAIVDAGTSVGVTVFATPEEAATAHPRGVRRLLALTVPSPLGYVRDHLTDAEKLALATSPYPSTPALFDDALLATLADLAGPRAPRDRDSFDALRADVSASLVDGLFDTVQVIARVLTAAREVDRAIAATSSLALMGALTDARGQLAALVHPGFAGIDGLGRLRRVPVYLAGLLHRIQRLADNPGRDRAWQTEVETALAAYRDAGGPLPLTASTPPRLTEVRWMLEELRLSLFAQHLGAVGPVSVQRVRKALSAS